ncbi:MAG: DNA repair protein RecO, partial [Desulfitobacteriaceae bacterium]|nr:DNA repair protein RecO [Desulfitobacteriaceae bacterium]
MSKIYSVEALILRARDYGEADKILTLYTREQGKVSAIAKGVRKPKSRLRGGV